MIGQEVSSISSEKNVCAYKSFQAADATESAQTSDAFSQSEEPSDFEGLTEEAAAKLLQSIGRNSIARAQGQPVIKTFLANFTHFMALLLWAGGAVAFFAQMPQIGVAIWLVNIINGTFSFYQEYRAEKATESLLSMLPSVANVIRDGRMRRIASEELVPGDLIALSEGDRVSADARVISAAAFSVDESVLTGESKPVRKYPTAAGLKSAQQDGVSAPDTHSHIYTGTIVSSGTCNAIVIATGMQTKFGMIAELAQTIADEPSPLQRELERVTQFVTLLAVCIGTLFFALALIVAKVNLSEGFIFALGMIVAFVPEGMVPTVSLALAIGVRRMARANALIKRLSAVETLGCTTVICTDKTGTITKNQMTMRKLWTLDDEELVLTGDGYCPQGKLLRSSGEEAETRGVVREVLFAGLSCNDARLVPPSKEVQQWTVLGDPTEGALLVAAAKAGVIVEEKHRRLKELPFDSHRKRMGTIFRERSENILFVKGAPKEVLSRCVYAALSDGVKPLSADHLSAAAAAHDQYARAGMRVLALAKRTIPDDLVERSLDELESNLTFLGLVALLDPPHDEVPDAILKCHEAGIKVIMITGDYELTAESIARQVGMANGSIRVINGNEVDRMDAITLNRALSDNVVFARVAPEHKLRIVTALQELGHIVAVTGDGVNDAPALKKAHIGIAMGEAGTDVAKESADMILTDDNFASIVRAIELGRAVYANIRKFAIYVFNSNMAEAVPFMVTLFSGGLVPLPLTVMQVLAIDLGTDMLPAIGLGADAAEPGLMKQAPRDLSEPLLNAPLLTRALLWYGLIEAAAGMSAYLFFNWQHGWPVTGLVQAAATDQYRIATTITLTAIVMCQIGAVLCCRSNRQSILTSGAMSNRIILAGVAAEIVLLLLLMYVPALQQAFNTAPLNGSQWLFCIAWIPLLIGLDEFRKLILRISQPRRLRDAA